ncbi:MAG: glycosyltransferase family 39 protein, partial [Anaerolineales bacterium]|nr:glycosyltransferase family 39 protein [Anaerolineales bacterium]
TGWFSFPSFYFVVQNIGILIWGQTETGLRIMSAVAGALTVPLLYGLVRQMVDRLTAVIAAALLAVAHHHVHFSRIGLNNIWDGLFVTAVLLTFWLGWQSGRRHWFVVSGAVLGFSQYFYGSMRIVPLIILVWAAVAFVVQNGRLRQLFPEFVLMAYASLIVYLPLALHFVDHPDVFSAPLTRVSIFGEWIENEAVIRETTTTAVYLTQLERSAAGIFLEPLRMWYTPHEPLLLPLGAILFVIGLVMSLRRPSLHALLLFLVIAGNVFTMSLTNDVPAAQRYMLVPPMVMVFVALPLGRLEPYLRQKPAFGRYGPLFITAMATVIVMAINLNFYFFTVYEDFVLGGPNTEVATKLAYYLTEQDLDELTVHFAGLPRMSFNSHSTLPFLVPQANGRDIDPPLTEPPQEPLSGRNVFVFLPERMEELSLVVQAYPGGAYQEVFDGQRKLLFSLYVVDR